MERFLGESHPPRPPMNFEHHHHHHQQQQQNFQYPHPNFQYPNPNSDHNGPLPDPFHNTSNRNSVPFSGRKRPFSQSSKPPFTDCADGGNFVKLYVVGFPRTIAEGEVRYIFGEYGNIVEVVLLKDKRTGQQGECGFVKYTALEEADRAVEALNDKYTFAGASLPVKVRYAEKERDRLGIVVGEHVLKLYVGCVNKQASRKEIEDIFSPYGIVDDVFIVRNDIKQGRGSAFVRFQSREMAVAAINALHGTYVMRGCDQPLIVRFADPKKPRLGDTVPTGFVSGPRSGPLLPNKNTTLSQPIQSSLQSMPDGVSSSYSQPKQVPPSSTSRQSGSMSMDDSIDCEWSEHICPDGNSYYYNCITCESRWEKPREFALFEEQLEKLEPHLTSRLEARCSSEQVPHQSSLQCQV